MASGILLSFGHALRGLVEVTARERNMKLHVLAGTAVGLAGAEVVLPPASRLALLLAIALVVAAEMANSALEALVDLHTQERREEARRVKDAAAGGVLVLAIGSVLLALAVLGASRDAVEVALVLSPKGEIRVRGRVVWVTKNSVGVRFDPLDDRRFVVKDWIDGYFKA